MNLFAAPTVPAAAIAVGASAGPALGADGSTPKLAGPTTGAIGQPWVFQVSEPRFIRGAGNLCPLLIAQPPGSSPTYLLSNAAFLSWFARQSPSTAIFGLYDLGGIFTTYSTAC